MVAQKAAKTAAATAAAVRASRGLASGARLSPRTVTQGSTPGERSGGKATKAAGERGTGGVRSSAVGVGAHGRTVAIRPAAAASSRVRSHLGAFSTSGSVASPSKGHSVEALNARLNASLPAGIPVAYANREYTNDLTQALAEARQAYYQAAAPPQSVLDRALYVIRQGGNSLDGHGSILYVLKKQRFFGIEICTGWKVENDGAGAVGGYTFGACSGEKITPPAGLPSLSPSTMPPEAAGTK